MTAWVTCRHLHGSEYESAHVHRDGEYEYRGGEEGEGEGKEEGWVSSHGYIDGVYDLGSGSEYTICDIDSRIKMDSAYTDVEVR